MKSYLSSIASSYRIVQTNYTGMPFLTRFSLTHVIFIARAHVIFLGFPMNDKNAQSPTGLVNFAAIG